MLPGFPIRYIFAKFSQINFPPRKPHREYVAQRVRRRSRRVSSTIANKVHVHGIQLVERVAAGLGRGCARESLSFHMACPVVLHSTHVTHHYASLYPPPPGP